MQRTELMQQLWKKAEEVNDFRIKKLLETAGNLVEATFTSDDLPKAIGHALKDSGSLVSLEDETNLLLAMEMLVVEE
jgi:hypothetical protein